MSHTKEPWPVFTDIATTMTPDPEGTPVAILSWDDYIRARACVNACAGISTDNLEENLPVKELARRYNAALRQRDELLAALKSVNESAVCFAKGEYSISADAISKVENAIASVKGGSA